MSPNAHSPDELAVIQVFDEVRADCGRVHAAGADRLDRGEELLVAHPAIPVGREDLLEFDAHSGWPPPIEFP